MISHGKTSFGRSIARLFAVLVFGSALATAMPSMAADCPDQYDFSGAINYFDPDPNVQSRIRGIESNHMNQEVRSLRKGQSTANASGDLRFVVNIVPNHPGALQLMMRQAMRDRVERLPEAGPYTVECWLHRATVFSPSDAEALYLYGTFLGRRGRTDEAIEALERAKGIRPEDIGIAYNLGLMYFDKKDYERSLEYARKAYKGGITLPGLKGKLQQAGKWRE